MFAALQRVTRAPYVFGSREHQVVEFQMNIEEEFRFDVRIRERMLKKGNVGREELERRLAALPDKAEQSEIIELDPPGVNSQDS
jgi:hypothetical protein